MNLRRVFGVGIATAFAATSVPAVAGAATSFYLNLDTSSASALVFSDFKADGVASGRPVTTGWMRAGSGDGTTLDDCVTNRGPMPNGTWSISGHSDTYNGSLVKGRVWLINGGGAVPCAGAGSTNRTEMLVHTDETATRGQACADPYIEAFCWDDDDRDYRSNGCIKISRDPPSPSDMLRLDQFVHAYSATNSLTVTR
jgi:hypothetical protein